MEVRTSDVYMLLDDLRLGVKSHSNSAMAGSCRNMPQYSLVLACLRGKVRIEFAGPNGHGTYSNSEPVSCAKQEWRAVRKVPFEDPNKGDWS